MTQAIEAFVERNQQPETLHTGVWYVRLKPLDKRAGHVLRDITVSKWRTRIRESKGWHRIETSNRAMLADLRAMRQDGNVDNRYLPRAFDICTFEEAKLVERREKEEKMKKREVRADVDHANVLSSSDLPSTGKSRDLAATEAREARAKAQKAADEERDARRIQRAAELKAMNEAEKRAAAEEAERRKAAAEAELAAMDKADEEAAAAAAAAAAGEGDEGEGETGTD